MSSSALVIAATTSGTTATVASVSAGGCRRPAAAVSSAISRDKKTKKTIKRGYTTLSPPPTCMTIHKMRQQLQEQRTRIIAGSGELTWDEADEIMRME